MKKQTQNKIVKTLTLFLLIYLVLPSFAGANSETVCLADAKQCPDGTYVGRTGTRCEFVCRGVISQDLGPYTLKLGNKSTYVKNLQILLNSRMGYHLVPDGVFGLKTRNSVISWQTKNNMTADGLVGPMTLSSLITTTTN